MKLKDIRKKKKDEVTMNAKIDPKEKDQEVSSDVGENVKSADRKPEIYTDPQGKKRVRMVPVDRDIVKTEAKRVVHSDRPDSLKSLRVMHPKPASEKPPFEGPFRKAGEVKKDKYGNVVKNVPKHLARTAARKAGGIDEALIKEEMVKPSNTANPAAHKKAAVHHIGQANNHKDALKEPGMETSYYNDHKAAHKAHMDAADSHMAAMKVHKSGDSGDNRIIDRTILANKKSETAKTATKTANESVIYEESDKSTDRLKMLVRLGLMDKKDMAKIIRSIGKMKEDKPVSPADRKILFDLLNELIGMVTGDEQIFQKAKKAVREEKDPNEYDKEGEMMKNQLRQICSANEKLMKMVGDDDNLPEWVQNKVTKATDYIRSVRDYLEAENGDDDDEKEMDEAKLDELSPSLLKRYDDASAKKHAMPGGGTTYKDTRQATNRAVGAIRSLKRQAGFKGKTDKVSRGTHFKALRGKK